MKCEHFRVDLLDSSGEVMSLTHSFIKSKTVFESGDAIIFKYKSYLLLFLINKSFSSNNDAYANSPQLERIKKVIANAKRKNGIVNLLNPAVKIGAGDSACRVNGLVKVNRVSGLFHITALGHGYFGAHVDHDAINFTHRIDRLSFGVDYPGLLNPLDYTMEFADNRNLLCPFLNNLPFF